MSLAIAAQHLAATGRGDDTELIHMSKPEVAGLMALAKQYGGTLTRNPQTGLIEAGFLRSILPMIAGLGLAATGIGAPMAAMLVGGGTALATGSLKQGLMAGLGAYGGGGLGEGLVGAGATSLAGAVPEAVSAAPSVIAAPVAETAGTAAGTLASTATLPTAGEIAASAYPDYPTAVAAQTPAATAAQTTANAQALQASQQTIANQVADAQAQANAAAWSDKAVAGINQTPGASALQGLKNLGTKGGLDALTTQLGGTTEALKTAAMAAAPIFGQTNQMPSGASDLQNTIRPFKYTSTYANPAGMPGNAAYPFFNQQFVAQPTYVAGTIPGHAGGGLAHGPARGETLRGTMGMLHGVKSLTNYAQGGISNLGGYSDGGQLLRGPGDGVSDSIPAQIGQHQPARLAEGEFVVPARIVSELGNGSTDAGAKKLYQMLNRIQAGRAKSMGGKNAYAKNTNADRYMPA